MFWEGYEQEKCSATSILAPPMIPVKVMRITNVNVGVLAKEGAGPEGDASPVAVLPLRLDSRLSVELCPGSGTLPVPKLL